MAKDSTRRTSVMVHRAPFDSPERFTAVFIEHTTGYFPLWLTPKQMAILPISEKFNGYTQQVVRYSMEQSIQIVTDDRNKKTSRKTRDNELKRMPYMVIVGEKEAAGGLVSMRKQGSGKQTTMRMEGSVAHINNEVSEMLETTDIRPEG